MNNIQNATFHHRNNIALSNLGAANSLIVRSRQSSFGEWDHNANQSDLTTPRIGAESALSKPKF